MAQRKNSGRTQPRVAFNENCNGSATKAGPGRYHEQGHKKASPVPSKGASRGFALHAAPAAKKERRAQIALYGRRQYLRMEKEFRRLHKAANDERTDANSTRHYESLEAA